MNTLLRRNVMYRISGIILHRQVNTGACVNQNANAMASRLQHCIKFSLTGLEHKFPCTRQALNHRFCTAPDETLGQNSQLYFLSFSAVTIMLYSARSFHRALCAVYRGGLRPSGGLGTKKFSDEKVQKFCEKHFSSIRPFLQRNVFILSRRPGHVRISS